MASTIECRYLAPALLALLAAVGIIPVDRSFDRLSTAHALAAGRFCVVE